jgi:hypothetical protein
MNDKLDAAKGIAFGLLISAVFWAALFLILDWIW